MACHITRTASAAGGPASPWLGDGEEVEQDTEIVQAVAADAATYPFHQIGALSAEMIFISQRSSSQARAAPIGTCTAVSPA